MWAHLRLYTLSAMFEDFGHGALFASYLDVDVGSQKSIRRERKAQNLPLKITADGEHIGIVWGVAASLQLADVS